MSRLYKFDNAWDWHGIGGFVVLANSPEHATRRLREFLRTNDHLGGEQHFYPKTKPESWSATDAEEIGPVFVLGGCDD